MARGTFGERLKRERELREVTLEEITSATRIGPRFLEALENEDWEKLPGGVFNRGFVRSIARYLGLDEEVLLGEYDLAHGAQVPATANPPEQKQKIDSPSRWRSFVGILILLLVLAAIAVGAIFAWKHFAVHRRANAPPAATAPASSLPVSTESSPPPPATLEPASSIAPASTSVLSTQKSQPSPSVSGRLDLSVSASATTHLLVLADGRVAFYDEVHAGESLRFFADHDFEVTAADSGAVLLELNGQAMPPLGVPGSSGTIKLSHDDLRQASGGDLKP